jgi:hypothetical protein
MKFPGFVGGAYQSRATSFDSQRCINLYPEIDESRSGKDGQIGFLAGTPGKTLLMTLPDSPGRAGGLYEASNGRTFCVSGKTLYELTSESAYTAIGTLGTESGAVCFTDNGLQLALVDGSQGYVYTFATSTFAVITDPNMPKASRCCFIDQYVIYNEIGTGRFYWSALLDASNVDALDFATAEGLPDNLNSLIAMHRQLWLFGDKSVEIWVDTGSSAQTFARIDGTFIEHGCIASQSVAKIDNTVLWLGAGDTGHGIIWRAEGLMPRRVSTHAVEYALSKCGDLSGATAYTYCDGGHQFYVLQVPGSDTTWVYDVACGLWHERAAWSNGVWSKDWSNGHCFSWDKHILNDSRNGRIYWMNVDERTNAGDALRWLRSSPFLSNSLRRMFHFRLQVDLQAGVGLQSGQGEDPYILMRYTNDGGRTWSAPRTAGMGPVGNYTYRAIWNALGQSRTRAYEVSGSDPVPVFILNAEVEVAQGSN